MQRREGIKIRLVATTFRKDKNFTWSLVFRPDSEILKASENGVFHLRVHRLTKHLFNIKQLSNFIISHDNVKETVKFFVSHLNLTSAVLSLLNVSNMLSYRFALQTFCITYCVFSTKIRYLWFSLIISVLQLDCRNPSASKLPSAITRQAPHLCGVLRL